MVPVEKRDAATLIPLIKKYILPGTRIMSDCWKSYECLEVEGYEHLTVNRSVTFVDLETNACTNRIEATWRAVKSTLPAFNRKKLFFGGYLAKYLFFKSVHVRREDPMIAFFEAAGVLYNGNEQVHGLGEVQGEDDEEEAEAFYCSFYSIPILVLFRPVWLKLNRQRSD